MKESTAPEMSTQSPPKHGRSLGWHLAFSTALIISLVMGGVSVSQQLLELEKDRETHEELLLMSLAPLAERLEAAANLNSMEAEVKKFHAAYKERGYPDHEMVLRDTSGKLVLSTWSSPVSGNETIYYQAQIPISSLLLERGNGTLVVYKHMGDHEGVIRQSWILWAAHFVVTIGVIFLFLFTVIYFQVTRPIGRLMRGVKKMEMGYWGPIEIGRGAWEIRWLAWRFGNMVQEVRNSLSHLLEAERKARSMMIRHSAVTLESNPEKPDGSVTDGAHSVDSPVYRELTAVCDELEAAFPDDQQAAELARRVWHYDALEASRHGFHQLKARLENAALRLMEPGTYTGLEARLGELKLAWMEWAEQQGDALCRMLDNKAIPCARVAFRVKHTAGVWAKMQGKGLELNEIHDLFAFRIIVPTEADCYAVLGAVHQAYIPEFGRFKDYIANPKANNYRSLHTCVRAADGPIFEVQIRSIAMERQSERGNAAHWLYKKHGRYAGQEHTTQRWWDRIRRWPRCLSIQSFFTRDKHSPRSGSRASTMQNPPFHS